MKKIFTTEQEANDFISIANELLGLPDEKSGTLTYSIPETIYKVDEEGNATEEVDYYQVEVTDKLNNLLLAYDNNYALLQQ